MRILLDESLPHRLRDAFPGHEVVTVAHAGWSGRRNGELLQLASNEYDLVTADQNLQYQQNLSALPITVAVLVARDNRLSSLQPLAAEVCAGLDQHLPRTLKRYGGWSGTRTFPTRHR
jgi:predicted nuclease of predicted toxin-antitoxin system